MKVYSFVTSDGSYNSFSADIKLFFDYLTTNQNYPASTQNLIGKCPTFAEIILLFFEALTSTQFIKSALRLLLAVLLSLRCQNSLLTSSYSIMIAFEGLFSITSCRMWRYVLIWLGGKAITSLLTTCKGECLSYWLFPGKIEMKRHIFPYRY